MRLLSLLPYFAPVLTSPWEKSSETAQTVLFSGETSNQWTTFHHPVKRVAVIGAGPAGLQAAAKLNEHNFTVRLFDKAPETGGTWFYTDETPVREPYPYAASSAHYKFH